MSYADAQSPFLLYYLQSYPFITGVDCNDVVTHPDMGQHHRKPINKSHTFLLRSAYLQINALRVLHIFSNVVIMEYTNHFNARIRLMELLKDSIFLRQVLK